VSFEKSHPTPPTSISTTAYHAWAKAYLPLYEKLASNAPNASTKKLLNAVVTVLKYEAGANSLAKLEKYIGENEKEYAAGAKALASAIISCASSFE
jgi:site-specific recombinase